MLEPIRGVHLLQVMNDFVSQSSGLFHIASVLADYPIFLIPLFLVITYIVRGMVKKHGQAKYGALLIVCAAILAIIINLAIQHFIDKARPETALISAGHLVMQHLPSRSFPSDHAAVAMAVALAALVRGYSRGKKKTVIIRGRILLAGSILMSVARVAVGVHRPTDILAGRAVAIISVSVVFCTPVRHFLTKYIIRYLVQAEEWVMRNLGVK